jgi:hypothetical protein
MGKQARAMVQLLELLAAAAAAAAGYASRM